jgi:ABC-type lipoprotein release transport system permease subunit
LNEPIAIAGRTTAVALLLAGVALLASASPAWRAARVSPSEALQE